MFLVNAKFWCGVETVVEDLQDCDWNIHPFVLIVYTNRLALEEHL